MSDLRKRNVVILANDLLKLVDDVVRGVPKSECYERAQIAAERINLIVDAAILEENKRQLAAMPSSRNP